MSVDGRLYDSTTPEEPLIDASVLMKIQILNPAKTCILYEEQQTISTLLSSGYFNIRVGSPTSGADSLKRTTSTIDVGNSMTEVFQNQNAIIAGKTAGGAGCSYTPASGDTRYFRYIVTPSTTGVTNTLSPDMGIDSVPQSLVAETLQGMAPDNFVQTNADVTQAKANALFGASYATLTGLLAGSSSLYLQNTTNGTVIPNRTTNPLTPAAGQIWYDSDDFVFRYYDGSTVQTLSVGGADPTKLPLAGGTMAGAIAMGSNDITGIGHMTQSAQRTIRVGAFTTAQEGTLVATPLVAGQEGTFWYNTTTDKLMYWDGAIEKSVTPVESVFGRTGVVAATAGDYTATQITNTAAGNIAAVTAQTAIDELDTEKVAKAGDTMTGALNIDNAQELRLSEDDGSGANYVAIKSLTTLGANYTLTLPPDAGASGQYLRTDGAGVLTWVTPAGVGETNTASNQGAGGVGVFKQKTTFDLEFRNINAASNKISVTLDAGNNEIDINVVEANFDPAVIPNTAAGTIAAANIQGAINELDTEKVAKAGDTMTGLLTMDPRGVAAGDGGAVALKELVAGGSNTVLIRSPDTLAADYILTLPTTAGSSGQVLQTDGSGVLTWVDQFTVAADSLDFTHLSDTMTLDASTDIAATGTNVLSVTNSGTGNSFLVNDQAADTSPFVIDAAGNVGVGTTTANTRLAVNGSMTTGVVADNTATGTNSFSGGQYSHSHGDKAFAFGHSVIANEDNSVAMGSSALTYGTSAIALGSDVRASGVSSVALGNGANTGSGFAGSGGTNSMAIGLGVPAGARPYVSGNRSLGIFMGDQSGIAVTANNVMAVLGGSVGIGTTVPGTILDAAGAITSRPYGTATGETGQLIMRELAASPGGTDTATIRAPDSITTSYILTLPLDAGASGQYLRTDGAGVLTWVTPAGVGETNTASNQGAGGVGVFKQKTTFDLEFRNINAASNKISVTLDAGNNEIDINVAEGNFDPAVIPNTAAGTIAATNVQGAINELDTEKVAKAGDIMTGLLTMDPRGVAAGDGGALALKELVAGGSNTVMIRSPDTITADYILTLPTTAGSSGQVLQTDGSGVLTWVDQSTVAADSLDFTQLSDTMTLDASTDIAATGTNVLSVTNSGTGNSFLVNDQAADTSPFVIDASGNVGIGTTSPSELLQVSKTDTTVYASNSGASALPWVSGTTPVASIYNSSQTDGTGAFLELAAKRLDGNRQSVYIGAVSTSTGSSTYNPDLVFGMRTGLNSYTERMRLDYAGGLEVGTNTSHGSVIVTSSQTSSSFSATNRTSTATSPALITLSKNRSGNNISVNDQVSDFISQAKVGGSLIDYSGIRTVASNATSGAEVGAFTIRVVDAGTTADRFTIAGSNVGIGTTIPGTLLDVAGAITSRPKGTAAGDAGQLIMRELAASPGGTDTATIRAPDSIGTSYALTLPDTAGSANQVLTTDGAGILSWTSPGASSIAADALDFDKLSDTMTLDASTNIAASGTNVLSITNTGTGNSFLVNDQAADTSPFVIDASGNVGVGTTTIGQKLDVAGSVNLSGSLYGPSSFYVYSNGVQSASFQSNGLLVTDWVGLVNIDKTGYINVSRGTSAGTVNIYANGGTPAGDVLGILNFGSSSSLRSGVRGYATENHSGANNGSSLRFYSTANGSSSPVDQMTIDQNGYVGIGTTVPGTILDAAGAITSRPYGTATGETGQLIMRELAASPGGTDTATIRAPDSITTSYVLTLPDTAGSANQVLTTDGAGILSWTSPGASSIAADALDFDKLSDTMTLDASTDIAASGTNALSVTNSGTGDSFRVNDSSGDTTPFVVDASGSVGIGTTVPGRQLHAYSAGSSYVRLERTAVGVGEVGVEFIGGTSSANWSLYQPAGANDLRLYGGSGGDRITFQNNTGYLGLGTTVPGTMLDVAGAITSRPKGVAAGDAGQLILRELAASPGGTDTATIRAPDSITTSYVLTLPGDAGSSGQVLQTNGSGVLTWVNSDASLTADSLDFTHFSDTMALDASTDIAVDSAEVLSVTNSGTADSFRVNDAVGDTTPFVIDQSGSVAIGTTTTTHNLEIYESGFADIVVTSATDSAVLTLDSANSNQANVRYQTGSSLRWTAGKSQTAESGSNAGSDYKISRWDDSGVFIGPAFEITRSTGYIGLGGVTPGTLLDAAGAITSRPYGTGTGQTGQLLMRELAASPGGNDTATIRAPDSISTSYVLTLPGDAGSSGQVLRTNGSGVLTWVNSDASITADSLDFTHLSDTMTLDASTDIAASGTNVLSITNSGTGNSFLVNDQAADTSPFVIDASGDVGIGTTTPATALDVNGVISSGAGSVTNPSYTFGTDADTGFYSTAANSLGLTLGGAATIDFTSTGMNISRRTNNTFAYGFDIERDRAGAILQSGDGIGAFSFKGYDGGAYRTAAQITGIVDATPGASDMPGALVFLTTPDGSSSATEKMRITSAGSVGIGTTNPGTRTHLTTASSTLYSSSGAAAFPAGASDAGLIVENSTSLDSTGAFLQLISSPTAGNRHAAYIGSVPHTSGYSPNIVFGQRTGNATYAERMRIDPNGNVGIGTAPVAALDVHGTGSASAIIVPRDTTVNRPAGVNGMIRYNTDTHATEVYQGSTAGWGGIPSQIGAVDLTGQTGNIGVTSIFTPSADGMYNVCGYINITTAGTAGTIDLGMTYASESGITNKYTAMAGVAVTISHGVASICKPFFIKSGTALQYSVINITTPGALQYTLHIRVHRLD